MSFSGSFVLENTRIKEFHAAMCLNNFTLIIKIVTVTLLVLCTNVDSSTSSGANYYLPGAPNARYSQAGDLNIGVLLDIVQKSDTRRGETCSEELKKSPFTIETTEAIAFAVGLINEDPYILPNTTLGFVLEGMCSMNGLTVATALRFLPQAPETINNSSSFAGGLSSLSSSQVSHDVVGILTPGISSLTVSVSYLMTVAHVPMIGPKETSNKLSGKISHSYFFRVVPPDKYQVKAILKFISSYGWSYISVVYNSGDYGQDAFDEINELSGNYGICIATSHRMILSKPKYETIVSDLLANRRARVVVMLTYSKYFAKILQVVADKNATGHFIWIGSDSLAAYKGYSYEGLNFDPGVGTFVFDTYSAYATEFYDYLKRQTVQSTKNPFFKPIWEWMFDCSFADDTCDENSELLMSPKYFAFSGTSLRIDAIKTFAQALHNLLEERCPDVVGADSRTCVTGPLLKEYLQKVTVDGFNGRIEFDSSHNRKGKYVVSQLVYGNFKFPFLPNSTGVQRVYQNKIKIYDSNSDSLTEVPDATVSWDHLKTLQRIIPWTDAWSIAMEIPESVCSRPCLVGEYKIEKDVPCCWDCVPCRENERLVAGNTSCQACPIFTWPDPTSSYTTCLDITPTFPLFTDAMPLAFSSLAVLALVITMAVGVLYFRFRNQRVIKASSRELSFLMLVAIVTGYITIIAFQIKPSDNLCGVTFFLFCMSFALLYCPLLVKTVRIYRIFKSGAKNMRPGFISPNTQLAFSAFLITVQAGFCAATYILYWPRAKLTQPIWSDNFVELSCDLTLPGLASFLGYNVVLVTLCAVLAFLVRNLPDNFNESKFISMCVSTTLLIWLAFIPTFFTADREYIRTFLLSVALLLNHSVAIVFLFIPKIYAVYFLPPEASEFSNKRS